MLKLIQNYSKTSNGVSVSTPGSAPTGGKLLTPPSVQNALKEASPFVKKATPSSEAPSLMRKVYTAQLISHPREKNLKDEKKHTPSPTPPQQAQGGTTAAALRLENLKKAREAQKQKKTLNDNIFKPIGENKKTHMSFSKKDNGDIVLADEDSDKNHRTTAEEEEDSSSENTTGDKIVEEEEEEEEEKAHVVANKTQFKKTQPVESKKNAPIKKKSKMERYAMWTKDCYFIAIDPPVALPDSSRSKYKVSFRYYCGVDKKEKKKTVFFGKKSTEYFIDHHNDEKNKLWLSKQRGYYTPFHKNFWINRFLCSDITIQKSYGRTVSELLC